MKIENLAEAFYDNLDQHYPPDTIIPEEFKIKSRQLYKEIVDGLGEKYQVVDLTDY